MATEYKTISILPAVGELSLLYLSPPDKHVVISSFWACNQSAEPVTFRLAIVPAENSEPSSQHYRYYDSLIPAGKSFVTTTGLALAPLGAVWVYSSGGSISFALDYAEIDL